MDEFRPVNQFQLCLTNTLNDIQVVCDRGLHNNQWFVECTIVTFFDQLPFQNVEEEDVLATHLLAAALAQIRQRRDHISHDMIRDVNLAEETAKQKMEKIDTSVSRLENK